MKNLLLLFFSFFFFVSIAFAQQTLPKIKSGDPLPADLFVRLAKIVNPAVVNIYTTSYVKVPQQMYRDPLFDLFFNNRQFGQPRPQKALGTGFVIRKDGLIITNTHVIDQADEIKVQFDESDQKGIDGVVVGKDAATDIALIKIKTKKDLPVLALGSSAEMEVGEWVAAFGNPLGLGHTLSKGIISAKGRELGELNRFPFLQTDANINPGNSGGPLVNSQGMVVGVNTAIAGQGIGFAIAIDNVKTILPQLEKNGGVQRGFIGVYLDDVDEDQARHLGLNESDGAMVAQVMPQSPTEKAGLKPYDLIIRAGKRKINNAEELTREIANYGIGQTLELEVSRKGKHLNLLVTIGNHPDDKPLLTAKKKVYRGQKAPFDLGFTMEDYNPELAERMGISQLRRKHPIVLEVVPGSTAARSGLAPGDVILDVNMNPAYTTKEAQRLLTSKGTNVLRILRQDLVVLLYLQKT